MGEIIRERVLRALGLGRVWVELTALSTRLQRLERDVAGMRQLDLSKVPYSPPPKLTIPASPPPPANRGDT